MILQLATTSVGAKLRYTRHNRLQTHQSRPTTNKTHHTTGANRNTAPLWALHSGPAKANLACSRSGLYSITAYKSTSLPQTPPPLTVGCSGRTNEAGIGKTGSLLKQYRGEFGTQLKQEWERVRGKVAWNRICANQVPFRLNNHRLKIKCFLQDKWFYLHCPWLHPSLVFLLHLRAAAGMASHQGLVPNTRLHVIRERTRYMN